MANVVMYTTAWCPYCVRARRLLDAKGVRYTDIRVDAEPERRPEMEARAEGRTSVPQIFIDDLHVGGFDDLAELDVEGRLDPLLGLS
ncbi:glutaredoxin 3 [Thioalbus denitrificans]|uniref:Glutaredoxin n=1 Tax=Thioalbus denitrificans TaxID=547122 RepID=A0A369CJK4_9GAMM|nr:glutaredoxin 3 [Thioalbus denitrificans]RCX33255.1 glutaredoxin 3 [Thioalbus denitrificans]